MNKTMLLGALLGIVMTVTYPLCGNAKATKPFEIHGWKPRPATRTPWTRWLNTFDFRKGAGDPDYYSGSGFALARPSNYRSMAEGRFGIGAPLFVVRKKRTQMLYRMGRNCPVHQATIELFLRSQPGKNIWNDGTEHHVFHLYGARSPTPRGGLTVSLIKTAENTISFQCQRTTVALPVDGFDPTTWYHLAVSWDAKSTPGRMWLAINGTGVTTEVDIPLKAVSYTALVIGNSPRESERVEARNFGDWANNWPRLWRDEDGDRDVYPLEGIVDEIHISDETLSDRLPQRQRELATLKIDWKLYQNAEDMVRVFLHQAWPNQLPLNTQVGGKYGGAASAGWLNAWMYEAYGDLWFLEQAERVGRVALMAQLPEGHFPTAIKLFSDGSLPQDLRGTETGLAKVGLAEWAKPENARIQDGFQDGVMSFLIYLYRLTGREEYLHAAGRITDLFIDAQNPNGSWSGNYNVKTKRGNIADNRSVQQGGEFDDGGIRRPFWSLILMYHVTGDQKYLRPLRRCSDWVLRAEIVGSGARGWAGFYDADNQPVQARSHEYPKIMTQVFTFDVGRLMIWSSLLFDDPRYLEEIRPAFEFYQRSRHPEKGWPAYYESDGRPFTPADYYDRTGWYGPLFGHFQDITYIEEAIGQLALGTLGRPRHPLTPDPEALADVQARVLERLQDPELLRWIRRDVQLVPKGEWVPNRPRLEPRLYGIEIGGGARIDYMIEYLLQVRIAAKKVPFHVALTGMPMPEGVPLGALNQRCWFVEDWFATPLRGADKDRR